MIKLMNRLYLLVLPFLGTIASTFATSNNSTSSNSTHCSLAFACGSDRHCFGMRPLGGEDVLGTGVAPATLCLQIINEVTVEATVTVAHGYALTRSNLWTGRDLNELPTKNTTAGSVVPDWKKFPHYECDSDGRTTLTTYYNLMHPSEVPTEDETEFIQYFVGHAQVQMIGNDETIIHVYTRQRNHDHTELELMSVCTDQQEEDEEEAGEDEVVEEQDGTRHLRRRGNKHQ